MNGREPERIKGDPQSPVNRGVLCSKGRVSLEYLRHPDRLTQPLKRQGGKGSGDWEKISWDQALDILADELTKAKQKYGPESIIFIRGSFKGSYDGAILARFVNLFGAPNIASMAPVCYVPRVYGSVFTHGYNPVPDYEYPPACIVVWGANFRATRIGEYRKTQQAIDGGSRLLVIDPRKVPFAERADIWVQPRPGTDLALALGIIHVIINEGLFDKDFVDRWTIGFQELCQHVERYSPEMVEDITWVKADNIKRFARLYAESKPAVIQTGNAIDHTLNNFQAARAIAILRAISGNLGIPGGELECSPPPVLPALGSPELDLRDRMSVEIRERRLDAKTGLLPNIFYALPQSIVRAILDHNPYPLKVGYVQGGNPVLTYPNSRRVMEALKKLDFLVVVDMFMTPTAAMADLVLPVSTFLEFDSVVAPPYYPIAQVQQKVSQIGECRSDIEIIRSLAHRLGLERDFWDTENAWLDFILEPSGLTFDEFRRVGVLEGKKEYRKHQRVGFNTPSGKVELYSKRLAEWGFDPLPDYQELPDTPFSTPWLKDEYPLFLTSWKSEQYRHSGGRQIPSLRIIQPEPVVWIHPNTATKYGIQHGDWVLILTKRGKIKQKAVVTSDIAAGIIGVDYGWWFPENGQDLYGWADSNINILTDDGRPYGKELGSPTLRGIACRITKVIDSK